MNYGRGYELGIGSNVVYIVGPMFLSLSFVDLVPFKDQSWLNMNGILTCIYPSGISSSRGRISRARWARLNKRSLRVMPSGWETLEVFLMLVSVPSPLVGGGTMVFCQSRGLD